MVKVFLATCLLGSNIIGQYTYILTSSAHELKKLSDKQSTKIFSVCAKIRTRINNRYALPTLPCCHSFKIGLIQLCLVSIVFCHFLWQDFLHTSLVLRQGKLSFRLFKKFDFNFSSCQENFALSLFYDYHH
jgi:hypothetical protein